MFNTTPSSQGPREQAQELAYDAMEVMHDDKKCTKLCKQALEIYPDCVDALTMLAEHNCYDPNDFVKEMKKAVAAGERDLGEDFIEQAKGHFWLDLETRPYMRALLKLAEGYLELGRKENAHEAVKIYEKMLELNPNDNQGIRDNLGACYLRLKRYEDAQNLFIKYGHENMAMPCWSRVLLYYCTQGAAAAKPYLDEARVNNQYVEQYLTNKKRLPKSLPDFYSPGSKEEAILCAYTLRKAWNSHQEAKKWLKQKCAEQDIKDLVISDGDSINTTGSK